jgi:hypothetical protein
LFLDGQLLVTLFLFLSPNPTPDRDQDENNRKKGGGYDDDGGHATTTTLSKMIPVEEGGRPQSIKQISDEAQDFKFSATVPLKQWLRTAKTLNTEVWFFHPLPPGSSCSGMC